MSVGVGSTERASIASAVSVSPKEKPFGTGKKGQNKGAQGKGAHGKGAQEKGAQGKGAQGKGAQGKGATGRLLLRAQSARALQTEREDDIDTVALPPEEASVAFWAQKVRVLQDEVRRANAQVKIYENELRAEKAKSAAAEVAWSTRLQDAQREGYENVIRQNMDTEQRLIAEYDAKVDAAYVEMKRSYEETVNQNTSTIRQQSSTGEKLRQQLASSKAKNADLEKKNQYLLKELNLRTSEHAKQFREEVFAESHGAIEYHQKVAQEAVTQAREQRRAMQLEAAKTGGHMEEQSSRFEQELNNAALSVVDQYRLMAKKAMEATTEERFKSKKIILEMEQNVGAQRAEFERQLVNQFNERVSLYKDDVQRLEKEISTMREHYDRLVQEMLSQIQLVASNFESETKKKALNIVESYKNRAEEAQKLLEQERAQNLRRQLRWMDHEKGADGDSRFIKSSLQDSRVPRSSRNVSSFSVSRGTLQHMRRNTTTPSNASQ